MTRTSGKSGAGLERLYKKLLARRLADPEQSYTARLLNRGTSKIAQKLGEEAVETAIAAALKDRAGVIDESADVLYHLLVLWIDQGIRPDEVMGRLKAREARSGLAEKAARKGRKAMRGKSR